jgi:thiol-disulfide isomerase/thioredoxin
VDRGVEVTLYERPGCHLCEVAAVALAGLARRLRFRIVRIDIESDPALEERYGLEIPVVAVDAEVVARAPIDLEAVRAAVMRHATIEAERGECR